MKVGLVGFSQSGKSTLFHALTGVAPDPAAQMKGQVGIAKVSDARLDFLSRMFQPKKTTPATVEFIDTPGLRRDEQKENPQRLATLRNADGLLVVLDGFSSAETQDGRNGPEAQLIAFREELMFADLEVVANRIAKLDQGAKRPKPQKVKEAEEKERAELATIAAKLEAGESLAELELSDEVARQIKSFQLFSLKPELVVLNRAEERASASLPPGLLALNPNTVGTAARLELDLALLDPEDRETFMAEMGVSQLSREAIIRAAYAAVGLISFFTVGEDECKAWTIGVNTPAVEAAGKIHSDIARGFIRAEVVAYDDLVKLGSMKEVKAKGLARLEGKEYVVADGDIINFRFSV